MGVLKFCPTIGFPPKLICLVMLSKCPHLDEAKEQAQRKKDGNDNDNVSSVVGMMG